MPNCKTIAICNQKGGVGILHELNPEEMEGAAAPHRAQQRENGVTTGVTPFQRNKVN